MILTKFQIDAIKTTIGEVFGDDAEVYLFGSPVDDSKRGGDIDLLVCSGNLRKPTVSLETKAVAKFWMSLGEQRIDLLTTRNLETDTRPIAQEIREKGIRL